MIAAPLPPWPHFGGHEGHSPPGRRAGARLHAADSCGALRLGRHAALVERLGLPGQLCACVRHPGYTGEIVYALAWPILLGSLVAFWVSVGSVVLWIARSILEDRTLQNELIGYREYAARVRDRLVPWVF